MAAGGARGAAAAAGAARGAGARLVLVAAAALLDASGRVLLASRPPGKALAGTFEFPGGKVEEGEAPEEALARELEEELAVRVDPGALVPLTFASHRYAAAEGRAPFHLLMPLFACTEWSGEPRGVEGQELRWATCADLERGDIPMPPADGPLLGPVILAMQSRAGEGGGG